MGYYGTATPSVILRNIFRNPGWYTSYTPYQAEISQGRLEALLNFQTVLTELTGLEITNSSLLDEATAAAEAMSMMLENRSRQAVKDNKNVLFVDENIFPQTLDVIKLRAEPIGVEVVVGNFKEANLCNKTFGAIVQYPASDGKINDYTEFTNKAHESEILVCAAVDVMALVLLKSPASWELILLLVQLNASVFLWDMADLMQVSFLLAKNTNVACQVELLELALINTEIKH